MPFLFILKKKISYFPKDNQWNCKILKPKKLIRKHSMLIVNNFKLATDALNCHICTEIRKHLSNKLHAIKHRNIRVYCSRISASSRVWSKSSNHEDVYLR